MLHRIVAGSAFLLAICMLPVLQYVLVEKPANATKAAVAGTALVGGTVAGVSTDTTITTATVLSCAEQQVQLADLDRWIKGKKAAISRELTEKLQPYEDALILLTGSDAKTELERESILSIIEQEKAPFLRRMTDSENTVTAARNQLQAQDCASE